MRKIIVLLVLSLFIGGCSMKNHEADLIKSEKEKYEIPVQEYMGKEFPANEKKNDGNI